jgi:hypothetical protein
MPKGVAPFLVIEFEFRFYSASVVSTSVASTSTALLNLPSNSFSTSFAFLLKRYQQLHMQSKQLLKPNRLLPVWLFCGKMQIGMHLKRGDNYGKCNA